MRILIIGGYGIFGGRLIELLDNELRLTLFRRRPLRGKGDKFHCIANWRQGTFDGYAV